MSHHQGRIAPQFFVTAPQPCPYLEGRAERKLFTTLRNPDASTVNDFLSLRGFRRSQGVVYRPSCTGCQACLSTRIPVETFSPGRNHRKVIARNADVSRTASPAQATDDQFAQLVSRIRGRGDEVSGELVITALAFVSPRLTPTLARFQERFPDVIVRFLTGEEVLRLEYGEAHVALRVGAKPTYDDYVVQPFCTLDFALFAHPDYIEQYGRPDLLDLSGHWFVGNPGEESAAPFEAWLAKNVSPEQVVLKSTNAKVLETAVRDGAGIGFIPVSVAERAGGLEQVSPALPEWTVKSWLVTHVDVHRSDKVQAMRTHLKSILT